MAQYNVTHQASEIFIEEQIRISQRRKLAKVPAGDSQGDAVGLALSGGGVRSATFNLGLLQALQRYGILKDFDYLSTVSGGGYIGAALTWVMSQGNAFPFGTTRKDHNKTGGDMIAWLRQHGAYLTPSKAMDAWSLATAFLRGVVINLLVIFPLLFALIYAALQFYIPKPEFLTAWANDIFAWIFVAGMLAIGLVLISFIIYAFLSSLEFRNNYKLRHALHALIGKTLKWGVILMVLGSMPMTAMFFIHYDLVNLSNQLVPWDSVLASLSISSSGVIAFVLSWLTRGINNIKLKKIRDSIIYVGLWLLIYGLLVWMYYGAFMYFYGFEPWWGYLLMPGLILALLIGLFANINHVSMHRYYRDRLIEAFMAKNPELHYSCEAANCRLANIEQTAAPYHIINTNLVTVESNQPTLRTRGSENFIFSPLYCGSNATGFIKTADYINGRMDLGTAFTISGAAINPNSGVTRSRPISLLMSLFNLRLGYWIRNPKIRPQRFLQYPKTKIGHSLLAMFSRPIWLVYMLSEMLGVQINENRKYVHLSDGGHFENLGVYELIRRRCRYIVVSDASSDPKWTFSDLVNLSEKVRIDFGAEIEINTQPLHPDENGMSKCSYVIGNINYCDQSQSGKLLYINTSIIPDLPEHIYGYKRSNKSFPDETSSDQFFDESQFEAYRELGYQIGKTIFANKTLTQVIS